MDPSSPTSAGAHDADLFDLPEHRGGRSGGRLLCLAIIGLLVAVTVIGARGALGTDEPATAVAADAPPATAAPVSTARAAIRTLRAPTTTSSTSTTTTSTSTSTTTTAPTTTSTTSTTQPPTTTVPPTTAPPATTAPRPAAPRPAPPTTTTTTAPAPKPKPKPKPAVQPRGSQSGQATWYRWKAGNCAHNSLPKGTRVTVTNPANGRSATCIVGDRGAFRSPTIIDLDATVFQQIAPLGAGRISVTITW